MLIFLETKKTEGTACHRELAPAVWIRKQEETKNHQQTQKKNPNQNQYGSRRISTKKYDAVDYEAIN